VALWKANSSWPVCHESAVCNTVCLRLPRRTSRDRSYAELSIVVRQCYYWRTKRKEVFYPARKKAKRGESEPSRALHNRKSVMKPS